MLSSRPLQHPVAFRVALGILKGLSITVGIALTLVCLMSSISVLTRDLLAQLIPALLIGVGAPIVLAERLLRDDRGTLREGLATDVLALFWLGFSLIFIAGAFPVTQPLMLREADILARSNRAGVSRFAPAVAWIARGSTGRSIAFGLEENEESRRLGVDTRALPPDAGLDETVEESDAGLGESVDARAETDGDVDVRPELTPRTIARRLAPSVVTLSIRLTDESITAASGVIVDTRGTVATALSVVENADSIAIRLADGRWTEEVSLVARDRARGLALLMIGASGARVARIGSSAELEEGASVVVLGNVLGLETAMVEGELLSRRVLEEEAQDEENEIPVAGERLILSASVNVSNVGGPVVNNRGEVVGIALGTRRQRTLQTRGAPQLSVAVPIEEIADMEQLPEPLQFYGRGSLPSVRW